MLTQLTYLAGQTPFSLVSMSQIAFAADKKALNQQALAGKSCIYTCILLHCDCIHYESGATGMLVASNQGQQHQA